jgi:hypothetical protein
MSSKDESTETVITDFAEFIKKFLMTGEVPKSTFSAKEILLFGLELYPEFDEKNELASLLFMQLLLLPRNTKVRDSFTSSMVSILKDLEGRVDFIMEADPGEFDDNTQRDLGQILIKYYLANETTDGKDIQRLLKFTCTSTDLDTIVSSTNAEKLLSIIVKNEILPAIYNPQYLFNTIIPILFLNDQVQYHLPLFTQTLNSLSHLSFLQSPNEPHELLIDRLTKIIITYPKDTSKSTYEALHLLITKSSFNLANYIFVMDSPVLSTLMIRSIKRLSKSHGLEQVSGILFNIDSVIYNDTLNSEGLVLKVDMIMEVINLIKYLKVQDLDDFIEGIKQRVSKGLESNGLDDRDRFNLDILQFTLDTLPSKV